MGWNKRRNNVKRLAVGSAIAAGVGYVAGVLTAPKSGRESRADLKSVADKSLAEVESDLKKLNNELGKVIDEAKVRGDQLGGKAKAEARVVVEKAKDTKEKVREMISAVREGDAQDKDLARAVTEANRSLKHLRKYLKK